jgi:hypothetical protein
VKARSKAQDIRLLLDNLERAAADAAKALDGLGIDGLGLDGKLADMVPKAPDGIRSWKAVLTKAYQAAKEDQNAPTNDEFKLIQNLETAKKARNEAMAAYREAAKLCKHRIRLEDPTINKTNGAAIYPDHPTCLVCGEDFEMEWYCPKSPELRCEYPNILLKGQAHFIRGDDLASANHEGDIECVHCGETWTRLR